MIGAFNKTIQLVAYTSNLLIDTEKYIIVSIDAVEGTIV